MPPVIEKGDGSSNSKIQAGVPSSTSLIMQNNNDVKSLIKQLRQILSDFHKKFGVNDIITNSKIFEVLIADSLDHILIPGHSGSRDAKDESGNEFEYKHYKESSSNHSWTFNDFSDTTIAKLADTKSVIFAHIQDINLPFPEFDWYYEESEVAEGCLRLQGLGF